MSSILNQVDRVLEAGAATPAEVEDRRDSPREGQRRQSERFRCLLSGFLFDELSGKRPIAVLVRNLSSDGAKLEMRAKQAFPSSGILYVPTRNAAWSYDIVWNAFPLIGLQFRQPIDLTSSVMVTLSDELHRSVNANS